MIHSTDNYSGFAPNRYQFQGIDFSRNKLATRAEKNMSEHQPVFAKLADSDMKSLYEALTPEGRKKYMPGATPENDYKSTAVTDAQAPSLTLMFQDGNTRDNGINGVTNEMCLAVVWDRILAFQCGPYRCEYNAKALHHIERAIDALLSRTRERVEQGIEGTSAQTAEVQQYSAAMSNVCFPVTPSHRIPTRR